MLSDFEHFAEALPDAMLVVDEHGVILAANTQAEHLFLLERGDLIGSPVERFVPEHLRERHTSHRARYEEGPLARPMGIGLELRALRGDGTELPVEISLAPMTIEGRRLVAAAVRDISERKRTEIALREIVEGTVTVTGEEFFRSLVRHLAAALGVRYAFVGRLIDSESAETIAIWTGEGFGENFSYLLAGTPCETVVGKTLCTYPSGARAAFPADHRLGAMGIESFIGAPLFGTAGTPLGLLVVMDDKPMAHTSTGESIMRIFASRAAAELERVESEEELRRANERFQVAAIALQTAIYEWDPETDSGFWTAGITSVFGYPLEEVESSDAWWLERVHPDDRERAGRVFHESISTGRPYVDEYRFRTRDGRYFDVLDRAVPVPGRHGRPTVWMGGIVDITERKHLEGQLSHSQRLDAIGRLAGGVAHDFNNLLTAIVGYADLLSSRLSGDDAQADAEQIKKAAERGAALTGQLLAFGRRQPLRPKVVEPNAIVQGLEPMLRRIIGEDVELVTALDPRAGRVRADQGQLEQVIMNLAVNARDAMPGGGRLTIETSNVLIDAPYVQGHPEVEPGPHVLIAVTDTGHGMDEETRSHVFEPFFTTKAEAKGTGLGLATVHGIVRQSKGHVWVYSEPEEGATFKIYLPRVEAAAETAVAAASLPTATDSGTLGGSETILLVEDDDTVRELVCRVLERNGYSVLVAGSGSEAIELLEQSAPAVELLLTDTVMPRMSGPELAAQARELGCRAPVLYMSGHVPGTAAVAALASDAAFLSKPFTPWALLRAVRETLSAID